jgi:hypothetical protein
VSVLKLAVSQYVARNGDLALALEGADGMLLGADAPYGGFWQQQFLGQWGIRIGGGTEEIQRNVLGERVLELPGEPRPDKTAPFRDLAAMASSKPRMSDAGNLRRPRRARAAGAGR